MSKSELLQQYKDDVNNLRKCAKELNFSDKEIDKIFKECFKQLNQSETNAQKTSTILKFVFSLILFLVFIYVLLNVHQPTSSLVLRNVQGLIYPGLKVVRFLSVPIIKQFPSLTRLYDESCLVENPFFYVSEMECWPCENVHSVIDLTGFNNHSLYDSGTPYIIKTPQKEIGFDTLKEVYLQNRETIGATNVKSLNYTTGSVEKLFKYGVMGSNHVIWRINKMSTGRVIRKLFPRPPIISEWSGQSIERFLIFDGPKAAPYPLPNPECSYAILTQATGERIIVLKPSKECGNVCKTISIKLKPSYVLWYNWWYWRPISLPVINSTQPSITYSTSYC